MWFDEMALRLILIVILSFLIWLEREIRHQPAWVRTHILIWLWSTLLMIISIMMPELYPSNAWDPARIAAQVVSWIWFIWAWVIMKNWFKTKWLTTAANIWVTSALWLAVWAWMYLISILATILILLNLVIISNLKLKYITQTRYCNIMISFKKNKTTHTNIIKIIKDLPIIIKSRWITEDDKNIKIEILAKLENDIWVDQIHRRITYSGNLLLVKVTENLE